MIARQLAARPARGVARTGFTLLEVLVVVAILVVLVSVSSMAVFRYLEDSKENVAKAGIATLETAIQAYKLSQGDWPPDLNTLTQPQDGKQ